MSCYPLCSSVNTNARYGINFTSLETGMIVLPDTEAEAPEAN